MLTQLLITLIFLETNLTRLQNHLPQLTQTIELNQIAQNRAETINKTRNFSHNTSWVDNTDCSWYGENLAEGYDDPVQAWLKSPTHRFNILFPEFNQIGIGKSGKYTVEVFCQE